MDSAPRNNPPISGRVPSREPSQPKSHMGGMKYPKCAGTKTMPVLGGDTKIAHGMGSTTNANNTTSGKVQVIRPMGKVKTGKAT